MGVIPADFGTHALPLNLIEIKKSYSYNTIRTNFAFNQY